MSGGTWDTTALFTASVTTAPRQQAKTKTQLEGASLTFSYEMPGTAGHQVAAGHGVMLPPSEPEPVLQGTTSECLSFLSIPLQEVTLQQGYRWGRSLERTCVLFQQLPPPPHTPPWSLALHYINTRTKLALLPASLAPERADVCEPPRPSSEGMTLSSDRSTPGCHGSKKRGKEGVIKDESERKLRRAVSP